MNNQRFLLIGGLMLIIMLIYQQWQVDYTPGYREKYEGKKVEAPINNKDVAQSVEDNNLDLPTTIASPNNNVDAKPITSTASNNSQIVTVETDLLKLKIDSIGGTIKYSELLKYPESLDKNSQNMKLLNVDQKHYYIAQSGLRSSDNVDMPNHYSQYLVNAKEYKLQEGQNELRIPFTWTNAQGFNVVKTFVLSRDSYEVKIEYQIKNPLEKDVSVALYEQFQKRNINEKKSKFMYTYTGGVIYDEADKYKKIKFDDFNEFKGKTTDAGWLAFIQHYFVTAWVPSDKDKNNYYAKELTKNNAPIYLMGTISPAKKLAASTTTTITGPILYVGPKEKHRIEKIKGLKLVVDYGVLTIISDPLFALLNWLYQFIGNWGWSIILVTVLIKAAFYKLSEASYKSMARMRKIQPKIEKLKERHGDDRQKMGVAQMELFKKEKVNPLGGCLPIVIQMPVFMGLYWMLQETVEIRQAPWILWIHDLSTPDQFYVLPAIMMITMVVQQKLNPAPVDPIQKKVMMFLPLVFGVFFAFFPAGLVLYWVANNLLSISQQYYITRHVLAEK